MILQPKHVRCFQIRQNGTGSDIGLSEPIRSFFITKTKTVRAKQTRQGGGDFEIVLPYTTRNRRLFSQIDTITTLVAISFFIDGPWDTSAKSDAPHPMPYVVETYSEKHDNLEKEHTITISGRGVLDVLLSKKVIIPNLIYRDNAMVVASDPTSGFTPQDIAVDVFGRNVNGDKTPTNFYSVSGEEGQYLTRDMPVGQRGRYVSDVSLLHNIPRVGGVYIGQTFPTRAALMAYSTVYEHELGEFTYVLADEGRDGAKTRWEVGVSSGEKVFVEAQPPKEIRIEKEFNNDNLLDVISSIVSTYNFYIWGKISIDSTGRLNMDYMIDNLEDRRAGTAEQLVYDYGAMPPRNYDKLLSTQEERQIVYVKMPPKTGAEAGDIYTVTRGSAEDNKKYKGWFCSELFYDASSVPADENVTDDYITMLKYIGADELYQEGNMLIKIEDVEYLFSPMRYYDNCWPGCIYTSIGEDGEYSDLIITALVLTGSEQDGWIITPELAHYTEPYKG